MADDLDLFYLIEGTQQRFHISVSYNSNGRPVKVGALRQIIFNRKCKDLAPDDDNLTLLKVNVDPDRPGVPLPLLEFDKDDEGVEEISPWQTIGEIWREPPHAHRIHIFVTFTDLPLKFEAPRRILKAAHRVYYKFWGEDVDKLLQPVPDCNLQYFTKEQIKYLGLRDHLLYDQVVLLVREEYKVAYPTLRWYKENPNSTSGGVVVTGQPGIGKTCFLYYLLFRLLSAKETVAFQVNEDIILFQGSGVRMTGIGTYDGQNIPSGTWALADSHAEFETPCRAFMVASAAGNAWIVQTTSPQPRRWALWHKERSANKYWMDVLSLDELNALGTLLHLDLKRLRDNYNLWGPSARVCISLMDPCQVMDHRVAVTFAADQFTKNVKQFDNLNTVLVSHRLFAVRPTKKSRQDVTVKFASGYLLGFVSRAYAERDRAVRQSFYKEISGHAWFATSAGRIFETHILLWFRYASAEDHLSCTPAVETSPLLHIPVCGKNMEFFSKAEDLKADDLKNVAEHERAKCLVPVSQTFPTLDAIVITHSLVITVQMTLGSKHDAKNIGFEKVYKYLSSKFLAKRQWCHVFLTDTEDKANSLRSQNRTEIPEKMSIHVYSAFVNMDELDSMLTKERVEKLDNDMEQAREQARQRTDTSDTGMQEQACQVMDTTE